MDRTYPLEIHVAGMAASDNDYKERVPIKKGGKRYVITKLTAEAVLWRDRIQSAVEDALETLPADVKHPRDWALPLFLDVEWIHQRIDAANGLKALSDFLAPKLDVDDRFYEWDGVKKRRTRGKTTKEEPGLVLRIRPATDVEAIRPRPKHTKPLQTAHELPGNMTPGLRDAIARADAQSKQKRRKAS